ncbi:MAG: hypothetical protein M2R45_04301 [Verrucomicrobia subdivision 3 bacterium]|nr:hypothetical protein [Limisphaerales bacterium]MCS1417216.1 hypothetical protein [Limisphaerales bacterium]
MLFVKFETLVAKMGVTILLALRVSEKRRYTKSIRGRYQQGGYDDSDEQVSLPASAFNFFRNGFRDFDLFCIGSAASDGVFIEIKTRELASQSNHLFRTLFLG